MQRRVMRAGHEASDEHFGQQAGHGVDRAAWSHIVRRFAPFVAAVARAHDLTDTDGEALMQEVFAETWLRLATFDDDDALSAWILDVTPRLAVERRVGDPSPDSGERMADLVRALAMHEALRKLPPEQRDVLRRRVLEGQEAHEIAAATGVSPDAIEDDVRRARRRLRAVLERQRRISGVRATGSW